MRILCVSPFFHPARLYAGPIETSYQLCRHLARLGADVRVLTTNANGEHETLDVPANRDVVVGSMVRVRYCARTALHAVSLDFLARLPAAVRWADVVHVMYMYSFPTPFALAASSLFGKPVILSPRGALQHWEGTTRTHAKRMWEALCGAVMPRTMMFHATSDDEAREIHSHFPGARIVVIPNGVAAPPVVSRSVSKEQLRLLFVGRLDPKKGIENLLAACAEFRARGSRTWSLTIAGAGRAGYAESLKRLAHALHIDSHVSFLGYVDAESRRRCYDNADVVVVPSYKENFGMVVAEALAHGVPVIASTGTPWRELPRRGCGLWVDNDPHSLMAALGEISAMPRADMGRRARAWMLRDFRWEDRAREFLQLYECSRGAREVPSPFRTEWT